MWRIRIDTACDKLALEVRDPDLLLAHFYTLDANGFTLHKLDLNPSKAWWQGLEDVQQSIVYLHGYGDRKTGQHKGVLALDASTGAALWTLAEMAFYGLTEAGLLVYTADAPEDALCLLAPKTGTTISTSIDQQSAAQKAEDYSSSRYQNCVYPILYKEGEPYFDEVSNFLKLQSGAKPVKAIAYAETIYSVVISYYEEIGGELLDNFVAVYDLEGNLCLKVELGSALSGIGSDTFFIFNLNLYLLQDKHILQVYRLTV
ncbi:DUF4905 domain-containing protein [uncultured Pontibacter sp.]|uniref:DUF4905 domain-containing protein n=1 Tax=uncultured Pontibacter sp. TaxID=453356 RepID=UPI002613473B|nr:DUF4905 domain-containing protein [uncultured Pontibacter sp.]